jgi:hypothetical protein
MRLLKNASVGIIVEGVAGIFQGATLQHERIFLKQRKGFIKCAIQSGVGELCTLTYCIFANCLHILHRSCGISRGCKAVSVKSAWPQ